MRVIRIACACLAAIYSTTSAAALKPPMGSHVLMDGRCDAQEWADAAVAAENGDFVLRLKRAGRFLYVCITYPEDAFGTFEGYLTTAKQKTLLNIHVSAKVGDREWTDDGWPEWNWWNARGWWGNTALLNSFEENEPRFLRSDARELQFDLDHFGEKDWRLMFAMYYGRNENGSFGKTPLPSGAAFDAPETWLELQF